ncbi:uncharacterized protein G2W53_043366 [Senna tora]|uniref:Uncharacterized protein n=1 Tax=Senna tora TaxID=362788 RepID=A0A834SL23_9FABA|nr:uncharacterized protein G2W53_043366 [Senna tora]
MQKGKTGDDTTLVPPKVGVVVVVVVIMEEIQQDAPTTRTSSAGTTATPWPIGSATPLSGGSPSEGIGSASTQALDRLRFCDS